MQQKCLCQLVCSFVNNDYSALPQYGKRLGAKLHFSTESKDTEVVSSGWNDGDYICMQCLRGEVSVKDEFAGKKTRCKKCNARVRESGIEPATIGKPAFLIDWLLRTDAVPEPTDSMIGDDPKAVEDALLASLQERDGKAKLPRFAYTLRKVATKASVPQLLKLAGRDAPEYEQTRMLLTRLDPSVDGFTFAMVDFRQSTQGSGLADAFGELSNFRFDPERKAELNAAIAIPMKDDSFFALNSTPEAAKVLGTWGDEKVMQRLMAILANPKSQNAERVLAIRAACYRDDPKVAASIAKWVLQEQEAVVDALAQMTKSAEIVATNLLAEKDARARSAGAQVLAIVGTRKCIPALTRASKDLRDPAAAEEAEAALAGVNARLPAATQPAK